MKNIFIFLYFYLLFTISKILLSKILNIWLYNCKYLYTYILKYNCKYTNLISIIKFYDKIIWDVSKNIDMCIFIS